MSFFTRLKNFFRTENEIQENSFSHQYISSAVVKQLDVDNIESIDPSDNRSKCDSDSNIEIERNGMSTRKSSQSMATNVDSASALMMEIENDDESLSSHPLAGMVLVAVSAICYAALNLSVKALMQQTPWQELMLIRMGVTWIFTMLWILIQYRFDMNLFGPPHQRLLLTFRAFFLWGAMFCCWWSFQFLPVGDGTALAMSFPVWVSIISHFVFRNEDNGIGGEHNRLDIWGWICVIVGLAGVIFIAQPSFLFGSDEAAVSSRGRDVGIIIGLCSAICAGSQYVIVNYTRTDCHWLQVEHVTAFLSTFLFMPIGIGIFILVNYYETGIVDIYLRSLSVQRWFEEIGLGLLGFVALALLTRGSQLDAPGRTAICLYLQIPCAYVGQCIITHRIPNYFVFIGITLILAAIIVPAFRKLRAAQQQQTQFQQDKQDEIPIANENVPLLSNNNDINNKIDISQYHLNDINTNDNVAGGYESSSSSHHDEL